MVQETMNGTGSGDHEWYRKPWMVQETMNGTGNPVASKSWMNQETSKETTNLNLDTQVFFNHSETFAEQ
jgi:hypothetical protein